MIDTPEHIKDLQLKLWLSKPPGRKTLTIYQGKRCLVEGIERGKRDFKIETNQE